MTTDLAGAARVIRRLHRDLDRPDELEHEFAEAILRQAVQNAASRPTPQAPMAAANMVVNRDIIQSLTGGAPAEVAVSSEFGSDIYPQFQRSHSRRGYWLYPAAEDPRAQENMDRELEQVIDAAIRSG